jgi:hypothetical protein
MLMAYEISCYASLFIQPSAIDIGFSHRKMESQVEKQVRLAAIQYAKKPYDRLFFYMNI